MHCHNCNFELAKNTNFCKNCGVKVNKFKISFLNKLKSFAKDNKAVFILLAVIVFFVLIFSISAMLSYGPNSTVNPDNSVAKTLGDKERQLGGFFDDNLKKSVVNIICSNEKDKYFDNPSGGGSGTMISSTGVVMTNFHVVSDDKQTSLENVRCMVILAEPKLGGPSEIYIAKPIAFKDISLKYDLAFLDIISSYTDEKGDSYGDYNKDFAIYDDSVCLDRGDPMLGEKIKIVHP